MKMDAMAAIDSAMVVDNRMLGEINLLDLGDLLILRMSGV